MRLLILILMWQTKDWVKNNIMIKLTDLLEAEKAFTATSKETGNVAVFKTKAARDAAVKAGSHEKRKTDKDDAVDVPTGEKKPNMFSKDAGYDAPDTDKSEPKKDEPVKDSSGGRAGNPQVNKATRQKAKELGITPENLGREEYELKMVQAAHEALTDSNFHSEARKLIAIMEDNPELEKNPAMDPNKPGLGEPGYEDWVKTTAWGSKYGDSSDETDELGRAASNEAGWDGKDALDGIAFELKMRGFKDLALKIQSVFDDEKNESTKLGRLLPEGLINEGTRSQVGIIDRSGKIASAYVHFDGYPSNMKPGLKKHMKNEKDVLNLIKRGGASGIYNDKDIKYYDEKSSPIKGNLKTLSRYLKSASSSGGAEYVYLYNMKDRKWYYADTYEDNELKKLF